MSVLSRSALEASPLADLHAIASELGLDGYRRLRKADLVDRIVAHQGGEDGGRDRGVVDEAAAEPEARPRRRRGGRGRGRAADTEDEAAGRDRGRGCRRRRGGRGRAETSSRSKTTRPTAGGGGEARPALPRGPRRSRARPQRPRTGVTAATATTTRDREVETAVEGVVELFANGSGFLRLTHPEPSDDDVYISAAQVRRCELVSGDRVAGPVRKPRRSERYPSLVRVDTINGQPADEVAEGTPFDELPCAWPSERIALGDEDPTLRAIEWLTPIGRGSRVTITGGALAGKTEALRRIARGAVRARGARGRRRPRGRPARGGGRVGAGRPGRAGRGRPRRAPRRTRRPRPIERAVETAKRIAVRGGHAVLLVDALDALDPATARRTMAAARALVDGGSLTVIAAAALPVGGETTVVALDAALTGAGRFPALDLALSATARPERLVGDEGAQAIAQARGEALDQRGT